LGVVCLYYIIENTPTVYIILFRTHLAPVTLLEERSRSIGVGAEAESHRG